jgi:hypothetical protein
MDWSTAQVLDSVSAMTMTPNLVKLRAALGDVEHVRATLVGTDAAPAFERLVTRLWEIELEAAGQTVERGWSTTGGVVNRATKD